LSQLLTTKKARRLISSVGNYLRNRGHRKTTFFYLAGFLVLILVSIVIKTVHYARTNTFRLLPEEVYQMLGDKTSRCTKMKDCDLQPGDILLRRYVTKDSWLTNTAVGINFTHVGFYLGNDQTVEAHGREKNHKDDIRTDVFSTSMWAQDDIQNWAVIRPKKYGEKINEMKSNLISLANDPNYVFGIPRTGYKRVMCADFIFNELLRQKMVTSHDAPKIITPDYLLLIANNHPDDFEILGYGFEK
jgi:hypothetical protein